MQVGALMQFALARPFLPFDIFLIDGRKLTVTHPENLSLYFADLGFWLTLPDGYLEFIDGTAVVSFRSTEPVDSSEYIR